MAMASYSGRDFVALLPEFHYNDSDFDWMFQLEKESNIVNLMCRYLDSNYILEEYEMERYLEWEADNSFEDMDSSVLHKSSVIGVVVDGNTLLDAEIEASESFLTCLPKQAETLKLILGPSQDHAINSQHNCEKAQQLCQLAENGCRILYSRLLEAYSETVKDFGNSSHSLNSEGIPRYLVHYPFDEMRCDRERWSNTVRATLTRITSEVLSTETKSAQPNSRLKFIIGGDDTSHKRLLKQIAMLIAKLLKARVDSIFREFDLDSILASKAALEALLEQLSNGHIIPLNGCELDSSKGLDSTRYGKIKAILQRKERNNIVVPLMDKFTEECNYSSEKYCLKISRLNEISDIVQEQRDLDLLTSIQFQLDRATVKRTEKLLNCFIGCLPRNKHKAMIASNQLERVYVKKERSASPLPTALVLGQAMPKCTVDALHKLFTPVNNASKKEEILHSIRLLLAYFSQRQQITKKMEAHVVSGPTTKPAFIDYNHLLTLKELEKEYDEITKEFYETHLAVEKLEKSRKTNPGCFSVRLLWVPFMNGCTERLEAIAAGDFSSYTIVKQQSGSHRKREWSSVKKKNNY